MIAAHCVSAPAAKALLAHALKGKSTAPAAAAAAASPGGGGSEPPLTALGPLGLEETDPAGATALWLAAAHFQHTAGALVDASHEAGHIFRGDLLHEYPAVTD